MFKKENKRNERKALTLVGVSFSDKFLLSLLFAFIFLFSISFVSAQPPFQQDVSNVYGYSISVQQIGTLKQYQNFSFNFHVFNKSTGYPVDNSSTTCFFHLQNNKGIQILSTELEHVESNVINEWEINVSGDKFSNIGTYLYTVQCMNDTNEVGGYESVGFDISPDGFDRNLGFYIIIFIMILSLIVLGYNKEDYSFIILGSFAAILFGLYILFYGIAGLKDSVYTWGIGIIFLMSGAYLGIRAGIESIYT